MSIVRKGPHMSQYCMAARQCLDTQAAEVLRDERFELAPFDPLIDRCDDASPVARRQPVQIRHFGNFHLRRSGRCFPCAYLAQPYSAILAPLGFYHPFVGLSVSHKTESGDLNSFYEGRLYGAGRCRGSMDKY